MSHFIPHVTSYLDYFIPRDTSYLGSLHTTPLHTSHFIPVHFIPSNFIPSALHTKSLYIQWHWVLVKSSQVILYDVTQSKLHCIPSQFVPSQFHISAPEVFCIALHLVYFVKIVQMLFKIKKIHTHTHKRPFYQTLTASSLWLNYSDRPSANIW